MRANHRAGLGVRGNASIGRARELAVLRQCGEEILAGRGGLLVISGAPGVGKTHVAGVLGDALPAVAVLRLSRGGREWFASRASGYDATVWASIRLAPAGQHC